MVYPLPENDAADTYTCPRTRSQVQQQCCVGRSFTRWFELSAAERPSARSNRKDGHVESEGMSRFSSLELYQTRFRPPPQLNFFSPPQTLGYPPPPPSPTITPLFSAQGVLAPVEIRIPAGSLLNPSDAAAVVGGNVLTSQRVTDVILKCFRACAASQGCMNNLTFGDDAMG